MRSSAHVKQSEIELQKTKEVVKAEIFRSKSGGGNLFFVNIREEAQTNAEAIFQKVRLAFMNTLLTYHALVNTVE